MSSANVRSLESIRDFRVALIVFNNAIGDALLDMQEQAFSALDWVENERPRYWGQQLLTAYDKVSEMRIALEVARLRKTAFDHQPSLAEEKEALGSAKKRLAYCQQKVELVKRTSIDLRHETDEFLGRLSQLNRLVETDIPKMIGLMERMLAALESYTEFTGQSGEATPG